MREAVIVSAVRTPVGRANKGTLRNTRPEDLGALVVKEAVKRAGIAPEAVEDVIMGCAMPEGEQGYNVARYISVLAGLPNHVPSLTVNRFCSSDLRTIAMAADRILAGGADIVVAVIESMTAVPMTGWKPSPHPGLLQCYPELHADGANG